MELFYGQLSDDSLLTFDGEESTHLVKVMRHREGDSIFAMDGSGVLFHCTLLDANPKGSCARIDSREEGWGTVPYRLTLACCPTKNNERFEWMGEKATELGIDCLVPMIGERSERKVYKTDRMRRIVLSAAKQSLKTAIPEVKEPVSVLEFIASAPKDSLRLIAYCFEGEKLSIREALQNCPDRQKICVLIGPEGDFSPREVSEAIRAGFKAVHLGSSRLRTETAALCSVASVYNRFMR